MKYNLSIAFILLTSGKFSMSHAVMEKNGRHKLNFLLGDWIDEVSGELGKGGIFSFRHDLNQRMVGKSADENYRIAKDESLNEHNDLLVMYLDTAGEPVEAVYYDHTGHPVNYNAVITENKVMFVNDEVKHIPKFRLRYARISDNSVNIKFDIARPDEENFDTYLEGNAYRRADQN